MRVPSPWATCSRLQGSCTEPRRDCPKSPLQPRKGTLRDYGRGRGDAFSLFLGHQHLHLRRPLAFFRQSHETVRKVPKVRQTWPPRAPKRHYLARFGPDIPAKSILGALLRPLFRQFLDGVLGSSLNSELRTTTAPGVFAEFWLPIRSA